VAWALAKSDSTGDAAQRGFNTEKRANWLIRDNNCDMKQATPWF
jgi:hypothetical protein